MRLSFLLWFNSAIILNHYLCYSNMEPIPNQPLLLKIKDNECVCVEANLRTIETRSMKTRISPLRALPWNEYLCSCSPTNNLQEQKYNLQNVLRDLPTTGRALTSCQCEARQHGGEDAIALSALRAFRTRRAPGYSGGDGYGTPQWDCLCDSRNYRDPVSGTRTSFYFTSPVKYYYQPVSMPFVYSAKAKSSRGKKLKDDNKKMENAYKDDSSKKSSENCQCFDIILNIKRPSSNKIAKDDLNQGPNCVCQQLNDDEGSGLASIENDYKPTQNANDDTAVNAYSYPQGLPASVPCMTLLLSPPIQAGIAPQQQPPLNPCACQKDYTLCSENRCCPSASVNNADISEARANVELLMEFLDKFKNQLKKH